MSISYQAKSSPVLSRQLEAQEIVAECNLSASDQPAPPTGQGLKSSASDAPSIVEITGALTARKITLTVSESISKCFFAQVVDRATGQHIALAAAPDVSVSGKISVTVNATGVSSSACVVFCYKVAE